MNRATWLQDRCVNRVGPAARGMRVAVVVLDACRTNPFARSASKGVGGERASFRCRRLGACFRSMGRPVAKRHATGFPMTIATRIRCSASAGAGTDEAGPRSN
jgi:hypothetical protein